MKMYCVGAAERRKRLLGTAVGSTLTHIYVHLHLHFTHGSGPSVRSRHGHREGGSGDIATTGLCGQLHKVLAAGAGRQSGMGPPGWTHAVALRDSLALPERHPKGHKKFHSLV